MQWVLAPDVEEFRLFTYGVSLWRCQLLVSLLISQFYIVGLNSLRASGVVSVYVLNL